MDSHFAFFTFFSLLLFSYTIDARKDPGEYWRAVMQDQLMPEAIRGLVHLDPVPSFSKSKKIDCHTSTEARNSDHLVQDFEHKEEKLFVKDFEPRPNISTYHDDVKPEEDKLFVKDFEPRPNISVYHDDIEPEEEKLFVKDFEPRPNISAYQDDDVDAKEEK